MPKQHNIYYARTCPDCGRQVLLHIKSKRCPDCQQKHNAETKAAYAYRKRHGASRVMGEQYPCERCGQLYELRASRQRWCSICAPTMHKVVDRQLSRNWAHKAYADPAKREAKNAARRRGEPARHACPVCGRSFESGSAHDVYCSKACRRIGSKNSTSAAEKRRRADRNKYHKQLEQAKLDSMTDEEREAYRLEKNRKARENYAKRKAKKEVTP